jgi:hypothetical protein
MAMDNHGRFARKSLSRVIGFPGTAAGVRLFRDDPRFIWEISALRVCICRHKSTTDQGNGVQDNRGERTQHGGASVKGLAMNSNDFREISFTRNIKSRFEFRHDSAIPAI